VIDVADLVFTYPGAPSPTLKGITFGVTAGEVFGFLGPSGAGKSTTQKLLIGLNGGYEGRAEVLGREARAWGTALYRQIGVGFELPNHFSQLTGLENLKLFASLHDGETRDPMALLDRLGIADAANTRVKSYSKGMAMRLNFARAILHSPRLLFLDEPTAGLDPANARNLKDIIRELKAAGTTIFLTTHDMHDANELCDRVAFIVDGELALVDSPRALALAHGEPRVTVEHRGADGTLRRDQFELRGLGDDPAFAEILRADAIETLHSGEATLEDIFIATTGRRLS